MGLMDILNGMQNGPRGQQQPSGSAPPQSGGMSPIMMALLGLLAFNMSMGQWLCVPMILVGATLWAWGARQPVAGQKAVA